MGTIQNFRDRVKAFNYQAAKIESLEETKDRIPEYTRLQLSKGQRSDGSKLKPYKNKSYALKKFDVNPLPGLGTPDYKLLGSFYSGIQTKINAKTITTFGTDEKSPKLELREGSDGNLIYGLDAENKTKYAIQDVKPVLFAKIRAATIGGV